jgi:hypothetical protein
VPGAFKHNGVATQQGFQFVTGHSKPRLGQGCNRLEVCLRMNQYNELRLGFTTFPLRAIFHQK